MAKSTYFFQECPTCGRSLEVRVEYLGKRLVCQHCGGQILASDPTRSVLAGPHTVSHEDNLARAEELIEAVDRRRVLPR